jgi:hypothetical protein
LKQENRTESPSADLVIQTTFRLANVHSGPILAELENRAYLLRQMARFLPEEEAAQLAFEFEQEVERLKAA